MNKKLFLYASVFVLSVGMQVVASQETGKQKLFRYVGSLVENFGMIRDEFERSKSDVKKIAKLKGKLDTYFSEDKMPKLGKNNIIQLGKLSVLNSMYYKALTSLKKQIEQLSQEMNKAVLAVLKYETGFLLKNFKEIKKGFESYKKNLNSVQKRIRQLSRLEKSMPMLDKKSETIWFEGYELKDEKWYRFFVDLKKAFKQTEKEMKVAIGDLIRESSPSKKHEKKSVRPKKRVPNVKLGEEKLIDAHQLLEQGRKCISEKFKNNIKNLKKVQGLRSELSTLNEKVQSALEIIKKMEVGKTPFAKESRRLAKEYRKLAKEYFNGLQNRIKKLDEEMLYVIEGGRLGRFKTWLFGSKKKEAVPETEEKTDEETEEKTDEETEKKTDEETEKKTDEETEKKTDEEIEEEMLTVE